MIDLSGKQASPVCTGDTCTRVTLGVYEVPFGPSPKARAMPILCILFYFILLSPLAFCVTGIYHTSFWVLSFVVFLLFGSSVLCSFFAVPDVGFGLSGGFGSGEEGGGIHCYFSAMILNIFVFEIQGFKERSIQRAGGVYDTIYRTRHKIQHPLDR